MLCLALVTTRVLHSGAPSYDLDAAFDALIEHTNELSGFAARYSVESSTGETGWLALDYAAPDRMRVEFGGDAVGLSGINVLADGEMGVLAEQQGEPARYARVDLSALDSAALTLLDERFPHAEAFGLEPGPCFMLELALDEETDRVDFEVGLSAFGSLPVLLSWLGLWRARTELLELTDDSIVLTHARYGATVARDTGFPSEIWMIHKDGDERRLRLTSLEIDRPPDDARFEFPSKPEDAQDVSAEEQAKFRRLAARMLREICFTRIHDTLAAGSVEWNDAARDDASAVFRALHEPWSRECGDGSIATFVVWIESYADWLEDQLARGRPREELLQDVDQTWSELEEKNATALADWQAAVANQPLPGEGWPRRDALLALEAEVVAELFAELVAAPVRRAFDEATKAVLDREEARKVSGAR